LISLGSFDANVCGAANTTNIEIGFSRANKEERMYTWSRRYDDYADVMHAAVMHEYDLPGNNTAEQRDLFLEVSI